LAPKAINYKTNSIVYFKGDASDRIYILNAGKVSLNYLDIETGQEIHELVKTGEFFGVKSALGRYPREETAVVLQDASVISFNVPEFEQLASQNTRVIIKMLKVFSNQLRRIHKRVQTLLDSGEQVRPETGLYKIGEYYQKTKQYTQALYAYKRCLVYYPSGAHTADVTRQIEVTEEYLSKYGQGKGPDSRTEPAPDAAEAPPPGRPRAAGGASAPRSPAPAATPSAGGEAEESDSPELSAAAKAYYNAVSLVSQQKFQEAFKEFQRVAEGAGDEEYRTKSQFEMGRCLYHLKQLDGCIKTFTALVQKYPRHPELKEALYFVGRCYADKGDRGRAAGFFQKILSMVAEEDPLNRKVRKALRDLGA
jgi:CRP-like cAMP-binding protein